MVLLVSCVFRVQSLLDNRLVAVDRLMVLVVHPHRRNERTHLRLAFVVCTALIAIELTKPIFSVGLAV